MTTQSTTAGKRLLAYIIDSLIISFVASIVWGIAAIIDDEVLYFIAVLTSALLYSFYFVLLEGSMAQASLGKRLMGIKIVKANGEAFGYLDAFLRVICTNLSISIMYIGVLMCLFTNDRQCLQDILTKTYVVDVNGAPAPAPHPQQPIFRPAGNPSLVCLAGVYAGSAFPIGNGIVIGTDPTVCQVVLPAGNSGVSRNHCKVTYDARSSMFVLHDMGSTNGTYLENGQKISQGTPYALHSGSKFFLANRANGFEVRF